MFCYVSLIIIFLRKLGFTLYKAEEPLQNIGKPIRKKSNNKIPIQSVDLKPFKSYVKG